jgi:hypothetical protein
MLALVRSAAPLLAAGQSGLSGYVLWAAGLVILVLTVVQLVQRGGPRPSFPQLTPRHWSMIVAWLVIAILTLAVMGYYHQPR